MNGRTPYSRDIKADSLEGDFDEDAIVDNKASSRCLLSREGAWTSIEFVDDVMVKPTKYTLTHCTQWSGFHLPSWVFEGSRDGEQWTLIKEHSNDELLNAKSQSHSWHTPNVDEYFNRFRVRMTRKDSDQDSDQHPYCSDACISNCAKSYLMAHALEIYGFVRNHRSSL